LTDKTEGSVFTRNLLKAFRENTVMKLYEENIEEKGN